MRNRFRFCLITTPNRRRSPTAPQPEPPTTRLRQWFVRASSAYYLVRSQNPVDVLVHSRTARVTMARETEPGSCGNASDARGSVRNLAYLASIENRQFFMCKAEYVRCATWYPRGVSSIRVLHRALGGASIETWIYRHATFSFPRQRDGPLEMGAEGEVIVE